jgi:ABC-type sugar transport system permease subunit
MEASPRLLLRKPRSSRRGIPWFAILVLVPSCLWLLALRYYAVGYLGYLSLQHDSGTRVSGFGNYVKLFTGDALFRTAVLNTIHYTVLFIAVQLPLALAIAVGINSIRNKHAREAALTAYFMPLVTSTAATAVVFAFLYNPTFGLFDQIFRSIGIPNQNFLNSPDTALNSVVFMDIWKSLGFPVLVFFTGLQTIPQDYYDAASVDGASAWQRFRYMTWPLLMPTTTLIFIVQTVETLRIFTPIYVMTGTGASPPGGPLESTMVWTLDIFQQAFDYGRMSYAAAMAVVLFVFVALLLAIQLRITRTRWEY